MITLGAVLTCAAFLIFSLQEDMRKDGVAVMTLNVSLASHLIRSRQLTNAADLKSSIQSRVSDVIGQTTDISIPDTVEDLASRLATRVSDLKSTATSLLDPLFGDEPLKITIGTDQVCYLNGEEPRKCKRIPSNVSELLPEPLSQLFDLEIPVVSTILAINVHKCLVIALVGMLVLGLAFVTPFYVGIRLLRKVPVLRTIIEVAALLLVMIPSILAATVVFAMPALLRGISILEVAFGELVWSLAVSLAMTGISGILFFMSRNL